MNENFRIADAIIFDLEGHSSESILDFQMEMEMNQIDYIREGMTIAIIKLESTRFMDNFQENVEKIEECKAFWFDTCEKAGIKVNMGWRAFYIGGSDKSYRTAIKNEEE